MPDTFTGFVPSPLEQGGAESAAVLQPCPEHSSLVWALPAAFQQGKKPSLGSHHTGAFVQGKFPLQTLGS